jgi:hypothetical protein
MNENDLAKRVVAHLDRSLAGLPAETAQKLQSARLAALSRHRPAEAWGVAGIAGTLQSWTLGRSLTTRLVLPAAIVVASVAGLLYWQTSAHHEEELDAGLLAGELPIHAYIDPGFDAWLKHTSHTPQQ